MTPDQATGKAGWSTKSARPSCRQSSFAALAVCGTPRSGELTALNRAYCSSESLTSNASRYSASCAVERGPMTGTTAVEQRRDRSLTQAIAT